MKNRNRVPFLILFLCTTGFSQTSSRYFMSIFGAQDRLNRPRFSHSFASFTEATGEGSDVSSFQLKEQTISWLPRTLSICAFCTPEPGANLSLKDSLDWAVRLGLGIYKWGPFEISKELYDRAVGQIQLLERGELQYVMLDANYRPQWATNCIHAVSDIDRDNGLLDSGIERGEEASHLIGLFLRRWILDETPALWMDAQFGLEPYHIQQEAL